MRRRLLVPLVVLALCAGALAYGHATRDQRCIAGVGTVYGPPLYGEWVTSDWQRVPVGPADRAVPC